MDENQLVEFLQNNLRLRIKKDRDTNKIDNLVMGNRLKVELLLNWNGDCIEIDSDYIDLSDLAHITNSTTKNKD